MKIKNIPISGSDPLMDSKGKDRSDIRRQLRGRIALKYRGKYVYTLHSTIYIYLTRSLVNYIV